jgi:hypothetical protein
MRSILVCTAALTLLFPWHALAQSCDAWFPFDDNLADASGNGNHGLLITKESEPGAATFSPGKIGRALHLTAGNAMRAFIDLHYDFCPQVTVTAWFRLESVGINENQYIISTGGGSGPGLRVQKFRLAMNGTGNGISQNDAIRDGNTWFFLAGVYDYAAGTYRLHWRNRVVEGELSEHRRPPEDSFWVGTYNDSMSYTAQSLYIDDLRIHGKALTGDELRAIAADMSGAAAP